VLIITARDDACKLYLAIGHVFGKILIGNCKNVVAVNKCGHRELRFLHIGHLNVCTPEELDAVFDLATLRGATVEYRIAFGCLNANVIMVGDALTCIRRELLSELVDVLLAQFKEFLLCGCRLFIVHGLYRGIILVPHILSDGEHLRVFVENASAIVIDLEEEVRIDGEAALFGIVLNTLLISLPFRKVM